jgi:hypothetical protein
MPRNRSRVDLFTAPEKAIYNAQAELERFGAHPLLTDALNHLLAARDKIADYVDVQESEHGGV